MTTKEFTRQPTCALTEEELQSRKNDPIWSRSEKAALEQVCNVDSPLINPETGEPYTTITTQAANGEDQTLYMVPEHQIEAVVRKLWPFASVEPDFGKPYIDLHSGKECYLREVNVIRMRDRNVLAAPDYMSTGGMIVDLCPKEDIHEASGGGFITSSREFKKDQDEQ